MQPAACVAMAFARCMGCGAVYPHWHASMSAAEVKKRGFVGCRCGNLKIQPSYLPAWRSFYWFVIRGWLIRKVVLRKSRWDPRLPVLFEEERP